MEVYLEKMMERLNSDLQRHFLYCHHWSDEEWKSRMASGGGGHRKRIQYCIELAGEFLCLRALQGHSGRNIIDSSLQDNVLIPDELFENIYHVGCAINSNSIINSGLIPGGQNLSKRQTVFFLFVDPMDKNHKDFDTIDLDAPRHAQYMHKAWKKHQKTVFWFDINLALKKGLKFHQTRSNAIILYDTLPAYCIPKVVRMETGEVMNETVYASPRPPPKISLKHDWMNELGSEVAQRPDGQVVHYFKSSQLNQPTPNPDHDRTEQSVVGSDPRTGPGGRKTFRSQEIETRYFHEEAFKHDRTGTPVVCRDASHAQGHEQTMLNEVNIDFRIPGLPHTVVKQAENYRVRELVKKIENHPHRHALQRDLHQNKAYNPFTATAKKMITECLSYWSEGIVHCTYGHLLKEIVANRGVIQYTMDFLSIPEYIIKKGRPHGTDMGKLQKRKTIIWPII